MSESHKPETGLASPRLCAPSVQHGRSRSTQSRTAIRTRLPKPPVSNDRRGLDKFVVMNIVRTNTAGPSAPSVYGPAFFFCSPVIAYSKPYLNLDQQVALLRQRGMDYRRRARPPLSRTPRLLPTFRLLVSLPAVDHDNRPGR